MASIADDESTFLRSALQGDKSAFVKLLRLHESAAKAVAYSVTQSGELMEDVLQESYLKAYRSIASYRSESGFKPWLCRIVRNTAIDELRRRRISPLLDPQSADIDVDVATTNSTEGAADRLDVQGALLMLTESQRTAILLVDGEQVSYVEAAQILDVPQGTVATRVRAARQAMRAMLAYPSEEEEL